MNRIFPSQLLLLSIIQQTHQQDPKPHILCNDGVVTIDPIWSGRVQHKSRQSSNPGDCTLTLKGLRKDSYVSVPGIDVLQDSNNCLEPKTTINNIRYCVKGANSTNQVLIKIDDGKLVVHLLAENEIDFIFSYFTNGKFYHNVLLYRRMNCIPVLIVGYSDIRIVRLKSFPNSRSHNLAHSIITLLWLNGQADSDICTMLRANQTVV